MTRGLWLLVALLAVLVVAGSAQDPCKFPSSFANGASLTTVSGAKACFDSIPSNSGWRTDTIDTMLYLASLYSFTDLARGSKSSGSSYDMSVDLVAQLGAMKTASFSSEWDFHNKMAQLWRSVHDAHTFYRAPAPYNYFYVCQPFFLGADIVDNEMEISVKGIYLSWYMSAFDIDVEQHTGKTISKINGKNAVEWLKEFSDQFYISKDKGVRFNSGLQIGFMEANLGTIDLPTSNTLNIVFKGDSTEYKFPWAVFILKSFTGTGDFVSWTPNTTPIPPPSQIHRSPDAPLEPVMAIGEVPKPVAKFGKLLPNYQKKSALNEPAMAMHEMPKPVARDAKLKIEKAEKRNKQGQIPVSSRQSVESILEAVRENLDYYPENANGVRMINETTIFGLTVVSTSTTGETVYMVHDNTAIISLSTFSPTNSYGSLSIKPCQSTIQYAISDAIETREYNRLLLDLRGNGGGLVCLSYGLQRVLVKDWVEDKMQTYGVYDFRKNNLFDQIMGSTIFPVSSFIDPDTELPHENTDFYTNGETYTRGGVSGSYTKKWYMNCDRQGITTAGDMWIENPKGLYFDQIAILTDGLCGSACSQAETNLHTRGGATMITIGGILEENLETSSFAGGAVYDWPSFVTRVNTYTSPTNPPSNLPTTAFTRFNFYECYMPPKTATLPREFVKQSSDFRLERWDFANKEEIYSAAIAFDWKNKDSMSPANMLAPQVAVFVMVLFSFLLVLF